MWQNKRMLLSALALMVIALTTACGSEEATDIQSMVQALGGEACLSSVAGKYCGNDLMNWADPSTLYSCPGAGKAPTSATYCSYGCVIAPAGRNDYCGSAPPSPPAPVIINPSDLNVFQNGNYSGYYLLWDDDPMTGKLGGWRFSTSAQVGTKTRVDNGECAMLVKYLSPPVKSRWSPGVNVITSGSVPVGTAVATFTAGKYDDQHSGFFGGYEYDPVTWAITGFRMYEQNWSLGRDHLVGSHVLKVTGSTYVSDADSYYVALASH